MKSKFTQRRYRALAANADLFLHYWEIGRDISASTSQVAIFDELEKLSGKNTRARCQL